MPYEEPFPVASAAYPPCSELYVYGGALFFLTLKADITRAQHRKSYPRHGKLAWALYTALKHETIHFHSVKTHFQIRRPTFRT